MEFFDNAVEKAREALDIACKKTNEVVTAGKQRFDIASIESKRAKDFENLGKLYFNEVKNSEINNEKIKAIVDEIIAKNRKIKEIKDEINEAKAKRVCPNCEAVIDENAVFCSKCGVKISFDGEDFE